MKQSRQNIRQQKRKNEKQNESLKKNLAMTLTKRDVMPLVQSMGDFQKGLTASFAILNAITHWMDKTETRKKEFEKCMKWINDRTNIAKQINTGKEDYKERIDLCNKWEINFKETIILQQIQNDDKLKQEEKDTLLNNQIDSISTS